MGSPMKKSSSDNAAVLLKPFPKFLLRTMRRWMPVLTYESDGYAVSPSVLRQVLERATAKYQGDDDIYKAL